MLDFDDIPDLKPFKVTPAKKKKEREKEKAKAAKAKEKERKQTKEAKKKAKGVIGSKEAKKEYVLALANEKPKKRVTRLKGSALQTIIGEQVEDIHQLLQSGDSDSAKTRMYKALLQSVIDVLPHAEQNIRKTKGQKGVYQFTSMITTIRELLIDVQASQDRGRVGELIIEKIIQPSMFDFANAMINHFEMVSSDAKLRMKRDEYELFKQELDKTKRGLAQTFQEMFYSMREQIKEFMER
ncbi:hypothetical protein [Achromobacter phage Motura]|uniref:Uncharacterized protein n=1 Tax=Achromobacter phage Motura TaxID=2591403 RepID=A0A514CT64_9CAUD|nr:hypothetical protein H1O15_gp148 [Achromobacter phage Motura]QDH83640.1 hypothetical protein [Achromobacter phage Motura]